jgi:hypothetical protein
MGCKRKESLSRGEGKDGRSEMRIVSFRSQREKLLVAGGAIDLKVEEHRDLPAREIGGCLHAVHAVGFRVRKWRGHADGEWSKKTRRSEPKSGRGGVFHENENHESLGLCVIDPGVCLLDVDARGAA